MIIHTQPPPPTPTRPHCCTDLLALPHLHAGQVSDVHKTTTLQPQLKRKTNTSQSRQPTHRKVRAEWLAVSCRKSEEQGKEERDGWSSVCGLAVCPTPWPGWPQGVDEEEEEEEELVDGAGGGKRMEAEDGGGLLICNFCCRLLSLCIMQWLVEEMEG